MLKQTLVMMLHGHKLPFLLHDIHFKNFFMEPLKPTKKRNIRHEHKEQVKVIRFLEQQKSYGRVLLFTANTRETYTGSYFQNQLNKASGVRPGLPDLLILLPGRMVWIELKRPKVGPAAGPSHVSAEQEEWITRLNKYPHQIATVCYGADAAIKILTELIGDVSTPKETNEETNNRISEFSSFLSR